VKVLIVNASDIEGGAARAAYRLHQALLTQGVDSQMLVQSKISDDFRVLVSASKLKKKFAKLRATLDGLPVRFYKHRTKTLFSPSFLPCSDVVDRINALNPDVVHLHWIAGGMIGIEDIAKIKAPIVWSLHDDWGFTGGCHIKWGCREYLEKCGSCPRLGSNQAYDLSRIVFNRKKSTYAKVDHLIIIGLSRWLTTCAKESKLFEGKKVLHIPNPINIKVFSPVMKDNARSLLHLPYDKKLILFGANSAISDINKGFSKLSKALEKIDSKNTELIVFGSGEPQAPQGFKQKVYYLGQLHDDVSLRVLYSAADVMVVPSLQENLSNAIMESLACGTPVVGFDVGGNSDLIDHLENGYLAKPFDTDDLAEGIENILIADNYDELCQNARGKVVREFDSQIVAGRYIELYEQIKV